MEDVVMVALPLDKLVDRRLDEIAASHGIGKAELVADVLRHYVEMDPDYAAAIAEAQDDVRAGRLIDHEEVMMRIERILASKA